MIHSKIFNNTSLASNCRPAIIEALASRSPQSASELARTLNLSYTGIQSQCLQLEKSGYLKRSLRRLTRGRPQIVYSLHPKAKSLLPSPEPSFSLSILRNSATLFGSNAPLKLLYRHFQDLQNSIQKQIPSNIPPAERLPTILNLLKKQGFLLRIESLPAYPTIIESHNPLAPILQAYPDSASYFTQLISNLLQLPLRRCSLPSGETALYPEPDSPPLTGPFASNYPQTFPGQ